MASSGKGCKHHSLKVKMTSFSTSFKESRKPSKQRKYRSNAPLHIRGKFLNAHLSDELSKKFGKRSARVRKGDTVKIMKGQFEGKTGKVEAVDTKKSKLYVAGVGFQKKEGTKIRYPVPVSSVMISELNLDDKQRQEILKRR